MNRRKSKGDLTSSSTPQWPTRSEGTATAAIDPTSPASCSAMSLRNGTLRTPYHTLRGKYHQREESSNFLERLVSENCCSPLSQAQPWALVKNIYIFRKNPYFWINWQAKRMVSYSSQKVKRYWKTYNNTWKVGIQSEEMGILLSPLLYWRSWLNAKPNQFTTWCQPQDRRSWSEDWTTKTDLSPSISDQKWFAWNR